MNKKIILLIILGVISLSIGGVFYYYESSLDSVNSSKKDGDNSEVTFVVKSGEGSRTIIHNLYEANLIKNETVALVYLKQQKSSNFQAGTYTLNRGMTVEEIFDILNKGIVTREEIQITFIEGKTLPSYVSLISKGFDLTEEEIYDKISDVTYLKELINKYWFLTEDILSEDIYYPLEGYLYPDTYYFSKEAKIEEIIEKMLDNTANKLDEYKEVLTKEDNEYSIHQVMTMASIIEKEGNSKENRETISQVIYTRLEDNWALGMDVTAFYGKSRGLKDLSRDEQNVAIYENNPYNTRLDDGSMNGKLPAGPINNPSIESIGASLNPSDTNYYWFVANVCTGEVYFQKTDMEFVRKCAELNSICDKQ